MGGNGQKGTCSSFTNEHFGSKKSLPSPSSGIFGSIFSSPSPKVLGRESLRSELNKKMAIETKRSKIGTQGVSSQDDISKGSGGEYQNSENKDMSSIFKDQRIQPCPLSSSIYYGGQDVCSNSESTQNEPSNSLQKKDVEEEDPDMALRGNWWQGGLYY